MATNANVPASVPIGSRVALLVSKGAPQGQSQLMAVPDVRGKSQGDALKAVQAAGLSARVFDSPSHDVAHDHVLGQAPRAGMTAPSGSEVILMVSSGKPDKDSQYVVLPSVIGLAEADAGTKIKSGGLMPETVHEFSMNVAEGKVIDQVPNPAAAPPPKSKAWIWWLIGALVLVAVALGAFWWFNRSATVPNVVGQTQDQAQQAIIAAGFKVGAVTATQTVSAAEVGKVVAESPSPGSSAKIGSEINIVVSGGQALITVPNVVGQKQSDAESALTAAGLKSTTTPGNSDKIAKGEVMGQAPAAGQKVPAGTSIGLTISQGPKNATVPNVVGETQANAESALQKVGLKVTVISNYNSAAKGTVYAQTPGQGTVVAPGTTVSIHVSNGPAPAPATVTVPNVIGQTQSNATTELKNLGFKVAVSQIASGTAGEVVGQAPAANTKEPKGSTVSIVVSTGSTP